MKVRVSSHLFEYTDGRDELEAEGATVREVLRAIDAGSPGFYFRIVDEQGSLRPHINVFRDTAQTRDLDASVEGVGQLHVLGALSGG